MTTPHDIPVPTPDDLRLRDCPWCGLPPTLAPSTPFKFDPEINSDPTVCCPSCKTTRSGRTQKEAAYRWNKDVVFELSRTDDPTHRNEPCTLPEFVAESNAIEGIVRTYPKDGDTFLGEVEAHEDLLALPRVQLDDLIRFVTRIDGGPPRHQTGMNVVSGTGHRYPPGGPQILRDLERMLDFTASTRDYARSHYASTIHRDFERLHPFMDGNGRAGRALWLWMMMRDHDRVPPLGFLQTYYYQTLAAEQ